MELDLGAKTGEYLFTQGVLGVACCLLIALCIYLERQRRLERESNEKQIVALMETHQIELAAERKYSREQQDLRFQALQAGNESQSKALSITEMFMRHQAEALRREIS